MDYRMGRSSPHLIYVSAADLIKKGINTLDAGELCFLIIAERQERGTLQLLQAESRLIDGTYYQASLALI